MQKSLYLLSATGRFWNAHHIQGPLGLYSDPLSAMKVAKQLIHKYTPPYTFEQTGQPLESGFLLQEFIPHNDSYSAKYPDNLLFYRLKTDTITTKLNH